MQPLLDGPRNSLSEAAVQGLLQSHSAIQITFGATGLDGDFHEVADLSGYMQAGSEISSNSTDAAIHRTCMLLLDSDVEETGWSYLSGFVRPHMTITDVETQVSATFHLGVFTLTTPTRALGTSPAALSFAGYDLLYLLKQPVADSYEVPAGSDPAQAAADVIGIAIPEVSITVTPSDSTLDHQMTWPLDPSKSVTYLDIVKTLLASIGYRNVWVDWEGSFRIEPFIDLQTEPFEWTFSTADEDTVVSEDRTQDVDIFNVPNWFRFVMQDLPDVPIEGVSQFTWTDTSPSNPGSTLNRGRLKKYVESVRAASYGDLVDYAQRVIAAKLQPAETFSVKTQPFPLAWHFDVIQYLDEALDDALPNGSGGERRIVATQWRLPLDGQTDMDWTWQTISDQTAALGLTEITEG